MIQPLNTQAIVKLDQVFVGDAASETGDETVRLSYTIGCWSLGRIFSPAMSRYFDGFVFQSVSDCIELYDLFLFKCSGSY